jgi:hypothetical protein
MRRLLLALSFLAFCGQASAAVVANNPVTAQIPNRGFVQFLGATTTTGAIAANAATSATGFITGNVLTLTAGLSGTFVTGATLTGTGVPTGMTITGPQISGTAGGLGTYPVSGDRAQSVASTTITATYGVLTVTCGTCTGTFEVGGQLTGTNVVVLGIGTAITQLGSGVGAAGTYYTNNATVVASTTITQDPPLTYKTLYSAGPNGSKCFALWSTNNDPTATHLLTLELVDSDGPAVVRRFGGTSATTAVNQGYGAPTLNLLAANGWPGLPFDTSGNPYVSLNSGDLLQVTYATAMTAIANKLNVAVQCSDF